MRGLEFEGNAVLARDLGADGGKLSFNWALGYLDAKYLEFIDSRGIDVADRRKIQNTPDFTGSGTIAYTAPVGEGSVTASTTLAYRSASQQFEFATPMLDQGAYALWDANIVWEIDEHFSLGTWPTRNISSPATTSCARTPTPASSSWPTASPGAARPWAPTAR